VVVRTPVPEELKLTVPSNVAPSKKLTVPKEEPVGVGDTAAVKVTGWLPFAGLGFAERAVTVGVALAAAISWSTGVELEAANRELPEYAALIK
jgi:hypothetical protein